MCTTTLRVRYADTDQMGIVYYAMHLVYFEVGRTELLRACGIPYADLEAQGYLLPVLEAQVRYLAPIHYDDVLEIRTRYTPRYSPTLRLEYEIWRGGQLLATGYTLHVFMTARHRRPIRPPAIFWKAVRRYILHQQ
ncbi:MAG: thioesterase family protein [Bacteroidota bacterium]|nr:thioesterase family protein [Bacteroidota bacterium]